MPPVELRLRAEALLAEIAEPAGDAIFAFASTTEDGVANGEDATLAFGSTAGAAAAADTGEEDAAALSFSMAPRTRCAAGLGAA